MPKIIKSCEKHGETDYVLEGRGYYRCKKCRNESVINRRRKLKSILIEELGGKCQICGYKKYQGALQFHHTNPNTKEFGIAESGNTRSLERLREEAKKCVLVCSNCHAEIEAGLIPL